MSAPPKSGNKRFQDSESPESTPAKRMVTPQKSAGGPVTFPQNASSNPPAEDLLLLKSMFKPPASLKPVSFMYGANPMVFIRTVAHGIFHLIYIESVTGIEGFVHPLTDALLNNTTEGKMFQNMGLLLIAPRRISKSLNGPSKFHAKSNDKLYKKIYFVARLSDASKAKKLHLLTTIAKVRIN